MALFLGAPQASAATVCASISGAKACVETYGDHIYLYDTAADGAHPEVYFALEDAGYAVAFGYCRQTGGANTVADCNFDFPESSYVHFVAARVDGSTLEDYSGVHTAYAGAALLTKGSDLGSFDRVAAESGQSQAAEDTPTPTDPSKVVTGGAAALENQRTIDSVTEDLRKSARALSLDEVQNRGLGKYVDAGRYTAKEPRVIDTFASEESAPEPKKAPAGSAMALATTCWEASYWAGIQEGVMTLYGQTDVTWCGDSGNNWINYSAHGCWGDEAWPTYKFEGCTTIDDYGHPKPDEYWNVYDVWSQYQLCPLYLTKAGGCFWTDRPQLKYRFGAAGEIWFISSNF
ncbi:hypothetical protein [Streptomyces meridianus]|uniref:Uncharacterized protein n=1 Tax=Streptomyces meridianus TaxID=2938945 RepID=A0ABT0XCL7_9ACTN|nr:hypothetical protein [Streptomyces meridianus]MCM2580261.1 hypothetical protein [Streptomyces meridianus]